MIQYETDEDQALAKLLAYQDKIMAKLMENLSADDYDLVIELAAVSESIGEF